MKKNSDNNHSNKPVDLSPYDKRIEELKQENPMFGMDGLLDLEMNGRACATRQDLNTKLARAYQEAQVQSKSLSNISPLETFFSVAISIGDITNRQHKFSPYKLANGGYAARKQGLWVVEWMMSNIPLEAFKEFLALYKDYVGYGQLYECKVRTSTSTSSTSVKGKRRTVKKAKVDSIYGFLYTLYNSKNVQLQEWFVDWTAAEWLSGNVLTRIALAKSIITPRDGSRQRKDKTGKITGRRELLQETVTCNNIKRWFLDKLSARLGLDIVEQENTNREGKLVKYKLYTGWKKARKEYIDNRDVLNNPHEVQEYVLFSTGKIWELDRVQFINWLRSTSGTALNRRVKCRLLDKDGNAKAKWASNPDKPLAKWFKEFEAEKAGAQQKERELLVKVEEGTATIEDKIELKKIEKLARAKTTDKNIEKLFADVIDGKVSSSDLDMQMHTIMQHMTLNARLLLVIDTSGSMSGRSMNTAQLIGTVVALKNPDPETRDLVITFDSTATLYEAGYANSVKVASNQFLMQSTKTTKVLFDKTKPFSWNLQQLKSMTTVKGSTNPDSIHTKLVEWLDRSSSHAERQIKIETVRKYPLFLFLSDGHFNSDSTAVSSIKRFIDNMNATFGFKPLIVVWDIVSGEIDSTKFKGLPGVTHIVGSSVGKIEQLLRAISDFDIIDTYTALKGVNKSNRYTAVREFTNRHYKVSVVD